MCEGWKDAGTQKCDNTSINSVCVCVCVCVPFRSESHMQVKLYVSHMQVKLVSKSV